MRKAGFGLRLAGFGPNSGFGFLDSGFGKVSTLLAF
jgi:hypothetical protein